MGMGMLLLELHQRGGMGMVLLNQQILSAARYLTAHPTALKDPYRLMPPFHHRFQ